MEVRSRCEVTSATCGSALSCANPQGKVVSFSLREEWMKDEQSSKVDRACREIAELSSKTCAAMIGTIGDSVRCALSTEFKVQLTWEGPDKAKDKKMDRIVEIITENLHRMAREFESEDIKMRIDGGRCEV